MLSQMDVSFADLLKGSALVPRASKCGDEPMKNIVRSTASIAAFAGLGLGALKRAQPVAKSKLILKISGEIHETS